MYAWGHYEDVPLYGGMVGGTVSHSLVVIPRKPNRSDGIIASILDLVCVPHFYDSLGLLPPKSGGDNKLHHGVRKGNRLSSCGCVGTAQLTAPMDLVT